MPIKPAECREIIERLLAQAESAFFKGERPSVTPEMQAASDVVFASDTQAYREALLGCLLAKIVTPHTNIRLPYVKHGADAFSGRSLDERVVNPFLREKGIPCSRGAYLSVFRRNVRFDAATGEGVKDKPGYDALLKMLDYISSQKGQENLLSLLNFVLFRFVLLREQGKVSLTRLERISLSQYRHLISGLLARQSGGLFPVILVLSMVEAIIERFSLHWVVAFHGINVADKASGAAGDISVQEETGVTILTIEVTERPVDVHRVRATFTEKVAGAGIHDYVFLVHLRQIGDEVRQQVERYFAQGYDLNFADIEEWLVNTLVTVGVQGRQAFQQRILFHMSKPDVPKTVKIAWNQEIGQLLA
jgi:hypothetical protein